MDRDGNEVNLEEIDAKDYAQAKNCRGTVKYFACLSTTYNDEDNLTIKDDE